MNSHSEHDAMFNVEQNLLLLSVVSDEGVQSVAVRHPANQAGVGGKRNDGVALNTGGHKNISLSCVKNECASVFRASSVCLRTLYGIQKFHIKIPYSPFRKIKVHYNTVSKERL